MNWIKTISLLGITLILTACGGADVGTSNQNTDLIQEPQENLEIDTNINTPPTISGTPTTSITAGESYVFQPIVNDDDGDTLTFAIANKPQWASFNTQTGELSGTAPSTAGTFANIRITVSDTQFGTSLAGFMITVVADESEQENLTEGGQGLDPEPAPEEEVAQEEAPEEEVVQEEPVLGTATLSWVAPATRSDGSPLPLSELAGFKIYTGTEAETLSLLVDISDISTTEYTVNDLEAGTHYYAVSAYNVHGTEGELSDVVSKTIN